MRNVKIAVFGGPVPQRLDAVTNLVPTGNGRLARSIADELSGHFDDVEFIGNTDGVMKYDFDMMEQAVDTTEADVIVFLPHLPNVLVTPVEGKMRAADLSNGRTRLDFRPAPKLLQRVKKLHPEALLVPFKIVEKGTPLVEIIRFMLRAHAALAVYSYLGDSRNFTIVDALGNEIRCEKERLPGMLAREILRFVRAVRRRSVRVGERIPPVPKLDTFVDFSRAMQPAFAQIVEKNVGSGRWPGNFSFRCTHGFSSVRAGEGFVITKRNVAKTGLTEEDFVYVDVGLHEGALRFFGQVEAKPSIDAPVHRVIYEHLPWVSAIVHGHLFCHGEHVHPGNLERWPCGAENEAYDIVARAPRETRDLWVANVDGHGFVALIGSDPLETGLDMLRHSRYAMNH
ncbi:MAG: class II aldolase/adducin family protein [Candidatus Moranbacteria bacterium]|nr:class II aldolase/adducin family protein [Candidatus Moranbacteria bacterium]